MTLTTFLLLGANIIVLCYLIWMMVGIKRRYRQLDRALELSRKINVVTQTAADYVKHTTDCQRCMSHEQCPIGEILHSAYEEQGKYLEKELMIHGS